MAHIDGLQTQKANVTFIRASMKEPLLTRDHEFDLANKWRSEGDTRALHELVCSHTRLVVSIAGRFRHYGLPVGDLVQEGNVGLMQAAARFEPDRGVRFATYATWWIRSAIQDYVLRNWSVVRTGTTAVEKSLFFKLRLLRARIEENSGAPLTDAGRRKIADDLQVDLAEVELMDMRLAASDQSLNVPIGKRGECDWQDLLPDSRPNPEAIVAGKCDGEIRRRLLAEALCELSPRERMIIEKRRLREKRATLKELAREFGISKERVRQLEHRALVVLRNSIRGHTETPADLFAV